MRNSENNFQNYLEKNELQRAEVIKKDLLKKERKSLKSDGDEGRGRKAFHGEMDQQWLTIGRETATHKKSRGQPG